MHALLFALMFQGLAVLALCCLVKALFDLMPGKLEPLRSVLGQLTAPVLNFTRAVTPAVIPKALHIYLAAVWLLTARVAFYVGAGAYGLLPVVGS